MHLAKYKRADVGGVIAHDERTCENHTNEKIDPSRSDLNYNLINESGIDRYNQRMSELFCLNRKDVNVLGSICVTLPEEVKEKDREQFFDEVLYHFESKLGAKNIISANVHMDETTPHIHIKFIPVYEQTKTLTRGKDKGKVITREAVSYDEVCTRSFYRTMHSEFQKYVDEKLGYHVGILNGKTKGVPTVQALKELTELEAKIEKRTAQLEKIESLKIEPKKKMKTAEPDRSLTGKETVPYETYLKAVKIADKVLEDNHTLQKQMTSKNTRIELLEDRNKALESELQTLTSTPVHKTVKKLKKENKALNQQVKKLNQRFDRFMSIFSDALTMFELKFNVNLDWIRNCFDIKNQLEDLKEQREESTMSDLAWMTSSFGKQEMELTNQLSSLMKLDHQKEQEERIEYNPMEL